MTLVTFMCVAYFSRVEATCGTHNIETIYGSGNNKATVLEFEYAIDQNTFDMVVGGVS